jgi:nicotinate-nucleotide adenylyltransferase
VRIGLFGGTFDPPHIGHLLGASDAAEALELDRLVFIPAAQQPLKVGREFALASHRVRMVELLVAGDARFAVDTIEIARDGLSYTVDTLEAYASRHSDGERFLLVGADVVDTFRHWRSPGRILELARLAVLRRAESGTPTAGGDEEARIRDLVRQAAGAGTPEPIVLRTRRVDVSSTEIRERLRLRLPIRGFVPDAVEQYITAHALYR